MSTPTITTEDVSFVSELPPQSAGKRRSKYDGLDETCRENPGQWAEFGRVDVLKEKPSNVRAGAAAYCKKNGLEFASRTIDGHLHLYAQAPQA